MTTEQATRHVSAHNALAACIALALGASTGLVAAHSSPGAGATPQATVAVTNCNDSGAGSLRAAAAQSGVVVADLRELQCSTITLTSGAIVSPAQLLFVQGPGAAALTIDGQHLDRVFYTKHALTLDSVTVTNGTAPVQYDEYGSYAVGGCVAAKQSLVISDSIVTDCSVGVDGNVDHASGGGVASYALSLVNSTISNSRAYAAAGRAAGGGVYAVDSATVYGSTIHENIALANGTSDSKGGGVFTHGGLAIHASTISGNTARSIGGSVKGGGVFGRNVSIYDSAVSNNTAPTDGSEAYAYGGGVYADGDLLLDNTTVSGNWAGSASYRVYGGGVYAGTVHLVASNVSDNTAYSALDTAYGGGISASHDVTGYGSTISGNLVHSITNDALGGGVYASDSIILQGSTISGNTAQGEGARGGGLASELIDGAGLVVESNTAYGTANIVAAGGGIYAGYALYLSTSQIKSNSAHASGDAAHGGGLALGGYHVGSGTILFSLSQSTLDGNTAIADCNCIAAGGGVYISDRTTGNRGIGLYESTISHNTAQADTGSADGGGVWGPALFLTDMTVAYNVATGINAGYAGGVGISDGDWTIENSTIASNSASSNRGGGIHVVSYGSGTLTSSIVYGNLADGAAADIGAHGSRTVAGDHNLVGSVDANVSWTSAPLAADPMLLPLADNGGPTKTMALTSGGTASPAIDAGSNPDNLPYDQRGKHFARRFGAAPDIGAYEVQPPGGDIIFRDGFD